MGMIEQRDIRDGKMNGASRTDSPYHTWFAQGCTFGASLVAMW